MQATKATIRFNQAGKLDRYFRQSDASGFGDSWSVQMDAMAQLGVVLIPCRKCGGRRRKLPNGEYREHPGCGFVASTKHGDKPPTRLQSAYDLWGSKALGVQLLAADKVCPACDGRGWAPAKSKNRKKAITAYPTGSSKTGRAAPSEATLADPSGEVMEWLCQLREWELEADDPPRVPSLTVIETFFGSNRSRVHLWPFTPAGVRLLRQAPRSGDLHPLQWLDNERTAAQEQQGHRNRALVEHADLEASVLLEQAADAWNNIVPSTSQQRDRATERECGLEPMREAS